MIEMDFETDFGWGGWSFFLFRNIFSEIQKSYLHQNGGVGGWRFLGDVARIFVFFGGDLREGSLFETHNGLFPLKISNKWPQEEVGHLPKWLEFSGANLQFQGGYYNKNNMN